MEGVVYELFVANNVPPLAALYQYTCSDEEAVRTTVPVPHLETLEDDGAAGSGLMMACTAVLVTLTQPLFDSA